VRVDGQVQHRLALALPRHPFAPAEIYGIPADHRRLFATEDFLGNGCSTVRVSDIVSWIEREAGS
jgi:hypothetical protein